MLAGYIIYEFHFMVVKRALQNICYTKEALDLIGLRICAL